MRNAWEHPVSGWPVGAWAMAGMLPVAAGIGISAKVISPGLVLDLISLWPGLVPVVVATVVVAFSKAWRRRMGAVPPLLLITWMALALRPISRRLEPLPSSSADLIGPDESPEHITLAAHSPGVLRGEGQRSGIDSIGSVLSDWVARSGSPGPRR